MIEAPHASVIIENPVVVDGRRLEDIETKLNVLIEQLKPILEMFESFANSPMASMFR